MITDFSKSSVAIIEPYEIKKSLTEDESKTIVQ